MKSSGNQPELPSSSIDVFEDSLKYVLVAHFPQNKSRSYWACIEAAEGADKYLLYKKEGADFHYACFGQSAKQLALALATINYLTSVKGTNFYAKGRLISERRKVSDFLSCALDASFCNDKKAHCTKVVGSPFLAGSTLLLPCNKLKGWLYSSSVSPNHPSTPKDQIQALAVSIGAINCPNFDMDNFTELHSAPAAEQLINRVKRGEL